MSTLVLQPSYGYMWRVARDWEAPLNSGVIVTVPAGFDTDLASVPRPFWVLVPPYGKCTGPAVLHDYLCLHRRRLGMTRKQVDIEFLAAMTAAGVRPWRRKLMYWAVRAYAIVTGDQ